MDSQTGGYSRLNGESNLGYTTFMDYCRMGTRRSIQRLADAYAEQPEPMATLSTLKTYSYRHQWVERAAAFDAEMAAMDDVKWRERRAAIREEDWQIAEVIRQLACDIIQQYPNFMRTRHRFIRGKRGEPDREITIMGIDLGIAIAAARQASDLQRLAAEMPNRFIDVQSAGKAPQPTIYLPMAIELIPIDMAPATEDK